SSSQITPGGGGNVPAAGGQRAAIQQAARKASAASRARARRRLRIVPPARVTGPPLLTFAPAWRFPPDRSGGRTHPAAGPASRSGALRLRTGRIATGNAGPSPSPARPERLR